MKRSDVGTSVVFDLAELDHAVRDWCRAGLGRPIRAALEARPDVKAVDVG